MSVLRFSKANPVRIVRSNYTGLNYKDPDNLLFHKWSMPYAPTWVQPFEQKDILYFHFESSFDNNSIRLINYKTKEVVIEDDGLDAVLFEDSTSAEFEDSTTIHFLGSDTSSTEIVSVESGYSVFEGYYSLAIPEGVYQLVGGGYMDDDSEHYAVESELIEVRNSWKNSALIKYYSNEPNLGIEWRTGATFQFRLIGDFTRLINKGATENILSANTTWTKVRDYTTQSRILELYEQVPVWFAEKINLILSNDVVTIDDLSVIGSEKASFDYSNQGIAWVKPSWQVDLKNNTLINRHDSATRVLF